MEYLSFGGALTKEDNSLRLKCNDITKNYLYTSEITVSVRILVGPQPFFLKFKTFTSTVKRRYFAFFNLSTKQIDTSCRKDRTTPRDVLGIK